ncbi:xylulokinase [Rhodohalobacter sp. 8-1]|uniref:xylulokinase n=1 Tax=Rhodohalobacter sp. 8-1 TaxID=3131972 RepID=UPI0030EE5F84
MTKHSYLLGIDVGSSSIKVSAIEASTGNLAGATVSPEQEMSMQALKPGWAEQDPDLWWEHVVTATQKLLENTDITKDDVAAIGISYQMHGLVVVDKNKRVLRPSIIWCDSRAADIGEKAFHNIGPEKCLHNYLNSPGNFTASKLRWVKENEPELYHKIHKIMLPGDFIAMKLTNRICTTHSGLSEGILWNFKENKLARDILDTYAIDEELIPEALNSFGDHGELTAEAAEEIGLKKGTKVTYRAGDQPNNAFSLNVLNPGEVAATAGTSGVIYGITDSLGYDEKSRVNTFVHVNHTAEQNRYGVLLCINGTGILNSWLRKQFSIESTLTYSQMNELAGQASIGSDGLKILPFGNGSERIFENKEIGAQVHGLNFNRHDKTHFLRAAQEGIVFSLYYGFQIMQDMGLTLDTVRAGHANMFLSPLFRDAFVNTTGTRLELYNTDGAQGAARAAGVGAGIYSSHEEAFESLKKIDLLEPQPEKRKLYLDAYQNWLNTLQSNL